MKFSNLKNRRGDNVLSDPPVRVNAKKHRSHLASIVECTLTNILVKKKKNTDHSFLPFS